MSAAEAKRITVDPEVLDELIFALAEGNMTVMERLYRLTHTGLYAFALSLLKDPHDAEDAVQDSYVAVCTSAYQYRSKGKPLAWMMTIVRNLAMAKLREKSRFTGEAVSEEFLIGNETLSVAERVALQGCMQILSDTERQIVVLHAVSGFKHREIAGILKMSLPAVLSRYSRALKKMKQHYEKEAGNEEF